MCPFPAETREQQEEAGNRSRYHDDQKKYADRSDGAVALALSLPGGALRSSSSSRARARSPGSFFTDSVLPGVFRDLQKESCKPYA